MNIRCEHCNGTGWRTSSLVESETLLALSSTRWISTGSVAIYLGTTATAMCNRLTRLLHLGVVEQRGRGTRTSPFEWRRA